jgi:lipoate-protein ligase A
MGLDEALLEAMPRLGLPVLRFYKWTGPAASFGYFQRYKEVERLTALRPLVRRPTAGGLVPHDGDWTYSVSFPPMHEWYGLTATKSYCRMHELVQGALSCVGVVAQLAESARKTSPGQCFAGHEEYDVLLAGQKIAGAAQRRRRDGLLIQGSVQPVGISAARGDWEQAVCDEARKQFGVQWSNLERDSEVLHRAEELATAQYSQAGYNTRR